MRSALSRRRRLLAIALLSMAAGLLALSLAPDTQPTAPAVVAAQDLPAGAVLEAGNLRVSQVPGQLLPADRLSPGDDPGDWEGRTLASPVLAGAALTSADVLGPGLLTGQPAGTSAVTVRVSDPAALASLRPGDHIDLLTPSARDDGKDRDAPARAVVVLALPGSDPAPAGPFGGAGAAQRDTLVVAAHAEQAQRLAVHAETGLVPVAISPSPAAAGHDGGGEAPAGAQADGRQDTGEPDNRSPAPGADED